MGRGWLKYYLIALELLLTAPTNASTARYTLSYTPYGVSPNVDEFIDMPFRFEYFWRKRLSLSVFFLFDNDVFDDNVRKEGVEGYKKRYRWVTTSELGLGGVAYPVRNRFLELGLGLGYLSRNESARVQVGGWEEKVRYLYDRNSNFIEYSALFRVSFYRGFGQGWLFSSYREFGGDSRYDFGVSYSF